MAGAGRKSLYPGRGAPREELPPMVLVHAAGGAGRNFFSLLRHLPPQSVAFDQPGHGGAGGAAPRTLDQGAANVLAVADQLFPGRPAVLVGFSLGGAQVLRAAVNAATAGDPARVAGVAVVAAGARLRLGSRHAALAREDFEEFLSLLRAEGVRAPTLRQLVATGQETVAIDLEVASGHSLIEDAALCERPAIVFAGGADSVALPESCLELAKILRAERLVVYPGAGHLLPMERPVALAHDLLGFAESLASA